MKDHDIERLLDRFTSNQISETEQERLISYFETSSPTDVPEDLENRLNQAIDSAEATDNSPRCTTIRRHAIRLRIITGVAASIAVAVTIGIYASIKGGQPQATPLDTCANTEEAYTEARKALLIFSSAIDKSVQQVKIVQTTTKKVQTKVSDQLRHIDISNSKKQLKL